MPTTVVVPMTATFTADGTANLKQVQQEAISPLDADFDLYISHANANDVFKAFLIGEGSSDVSADVIVSVDSSGAAIVKAALKYALENALGGADATSDASGETLKSRMETYVKAQVENDLSSTGLFNILEAEELLAVTIPNADIGDNGSAAMWSALAAQTASKNNALLNCIATQLPYLQYVDISSGGNLNAAFAVGDKLVFNFTINTTLEVTPQEQDVTATPAGAATGAVDASGNFVASPTGSARPAFDSAQKTRTFNIHIIKA